MDINTILSDTLNLESYWNLRNEQMRIDREIINLIQPTQTTKQVKWISNEPKVFFDTSRALVSTNAPKFRLPMSINPEAEEKQKMNKAERLCIGIYRTLNGRESARGEGDWLWNLAYWVLLGWWSVLTYVRKSDNGIEFIADIWDPMTVYPQWDGDKMVTCVRTYTTDKITAMAMASDLIARGSRGAFKEPSKNGDIKVINWWKNDRGKIYNAILINGESVKPVTLQKKMRRIPIHVGAVGSPDRITPNWEERRGESIIAPDRNMYEYLNSILSLRATILAETAYPNIITKTRSGMPALTQEQIGQGYGQVSAIKLEDQIEILKHAATPADADALLNYIGQQIQKGSVPNSVYGSIPFEISGFALSQLLAAVKYKLGPYLSAMQAITSGVFSDFLFQYKIGKFGKITLSTENPFDLKRGMTYIEEFSTDDVPENIFVEVTIPITSTFDKTQAILNARQSLTPPQLFSRETLWEADLDVQDTEQEYQRIRQDQVLNDPFVMQIEIIEAMWQRYETYLVQGNTIKADALKRYIQGLEMQLGMRQGVVETKSEGIRPELSPPEARENPDQLNAVLGKGPTSPRRPVTTGASEGRLGKLVSPSGETLVR